METSGPFDVDDRARRPRGLDHAAGLMDRLRDRDVFDLDGERLGRIRKGFVEDGRLVAAELTVDSGLQRALGTDGDVARFPVDWIVGESDEGVRLRVPATEVLGVGATPPDLRGSDSFPREVR